MGILKDGADLAYSRDFRRVTAAAAAFVAFEVMRESEATSNHDVRQFMARQVLLNPESYEGYFSWLCAVAVPIASEGPVLTEAHEAMILERIENLWTHAARFWYGESFAGDSNG